MMCQQQQHPLLLRPHPRPPYVTAAVMIEGTDQIQAEARWADYSIRRVI